MDDSEPRCDRAVIEQREERPDRAVAGEDGVGREIGEEHHG
jgi:hypothetical protein